ncbi:hypothetical protein ACFX13_041048 [Malus domestica]
MWTRSFWFVQFRLVRTRSIWCHGAVSARADKEHLVPCCSFSSCRQGAFGAVLQFQLVQARSVGVAFYARADQERCAMQFRLVQARSLMSYSLGSCGQGAFGSCSLGSCEQGAFGAVVQFQLVQTRSIWCRVAVSARAGKERLVPCCSFSSCRQGALVLPFMLVQTRSVVPCSLGSCRRGALCPTV